MERCAYNLVRVLRPSRRREPRERAREARTCAGGVHLVAGNIRRNPVSRVPGEDRGEAPSASNEVGSAVHAATEALAAAEGQVVEGSSVPVVAGLGAFVTEVNSGADRGGGAVTAGFTAVGGSGSRTLVVGQRLVEGEFGVEFESILQAMIGRKL